MRTFEIPAVGGIQLAPYSVEHEMFFEEGKEIFLYRTTEELIMKAWHILGLSEEEASSIRENALKRCSLDDYSYEGRSKIVLKAFKELLNEH
jgi:spore maturation protein CgeB